MSSSPVSVAVVWAWSTRPATSSWAVSVALKFLPPQWSHDEGAKQRFVREAQAASATNHRNICVIHNIEETPPMGVCSSSWPTTKAETLKQKLETGSVADHRGD